eukprot:scaffold224818_cov33-Tisochrysis_lutea.AAC.2
MRSVVGVDVCGVWGWCGVLVLARPWLSAISMGASASLSLFVLVRGRSVVAVMRAWLDGSSWRGRFGDSGVSIS